MKRFFSILLSVILVFGMCSVVCFADDSAYWKAQSAYAAAKNSGDKNAIISAVKMIEAAYPSPCNETQYNRLATPVLNVAKIYEEQTKYDDAVAYYKKAQRYFTWLDQNTSQSYHDYFVDFPKVIEHLSVQPEVYTATSNVKSLPYYNAKYEPKAGTYFGTCNTFEQNKESAFLLYVQFGNQKISDFFYRVPQTSQDYILEIAWNAPTENKAFFDQVNSGKWDNYIKEQLTFLSKQKGKIFLRFAAEMNIWADNTNNGAAHAAAFKNAYLRIAKKARSIAPNVALVFSPNDVSNRNVKVTDFYPGDSYVDWVGMSSYRNIAADAKSGVDISNAYFCNGDYENQMLQIKEIADTYGHKKPIMISECGFSFYCDDKTKPQTQAHAVQRMKEFYTYVNQVYPMVKAVLYFDTTFGKNHYALGENQTVKSTYDKAVASNIAMQSTLPGKTATGYVKVDDFSEKRSQMTFSVYAYYPAHKPTTVTVYVDGVKKLSSSTAPYSVSVNTEKWSVGTHTLRVCATGGATSRSVIKVFQKNKSGVITCTGSIRDVPNSHWASSYIDNALRKEVFKGMSFSSFAPENVMTRAMFVQVLANISGQDVKTYKTDKFTDVKSKDWYYRAVAWANQKGVVNGVGKNKFDPNGRITREQMCVMLERYATVMRIKMPTNGQVNSFKDQAKISSWAKSAVITCQKAGLISGEKRNGYFYFDPQNGATRAQACKIFSIFIKF